VDRLAAHRSASPAVGQTGAGVLSRGRRACIGARDSATYCYIARRSGSTSSTRESDPGHGGGSRWTRNNRTDPAPNDRHLRIAIRRPTCSRHLCYRRVPLQQHPHRKGVAQIVDTRSPRRIGAAPGAFTEVLEYAEDRHVEQSAAGQRDAGAVAFRLRTEAVVQQCILEQSIEGVGGDGNPCGTCRTSTAISRTAWPQSISARSRVSASPMRISGRDQQSEQR
jgi:hypothetical protein